MKKNIVYCMAIVAIVLSSCSEDDQGPQGQNPETLQANAGVDQTVAPLTKVTLDGAASTGPASGFNYSWTNTGGPETVNLTSISDDGSKVEFEPKKNGVYNFRLRLVSGSEFSEDDVTVTVAGSLSLGGTLSAHTTLQDINADPSQPDYTLSSDLIIPDGVTLSFPGTSVTIDATNGSGIIISTGGRLSISNGSNHKMTAATGWKGILVDGGAIEISQLVTIENAGASAFTGQTEAAALTFAGTLPKITNLNSAMFKGTVSANDILVLGEVNATDLIITGNIFSTAKPIKAPISFVGKIGGNNQFGTYDYIHLVPSGGGTIDALVSGQYSFTHNYTYYIDGDFLAGSDISITNATILMKEGAGILAQKSLSTNNATIKGVDTKNWKGIAYASNSHQIILANTTIENAGSDVFNTGFFTSPVKAAIYFSLGTGSLSSVKITNSGGYGVYNDNATQSLPLSNCTFTGTTQAAVSARVDLIHSTISTTPSTYTMAAGIPAVEVRVPNSTVSPVSTWQALGGSNFYLFSGNAYLSSGSWALAPGVNVKFKAGKSLNLTSGLFVAIGTAVAPIVFDSEAGTQGTWAGIHVQTQTKIEYCQIKNGGELLILKNGVTPATQKANVVFDYTAGVTTNTFKNNTISGSGGYGILVEAGKQKPDASNVANNNTFTGNVSGASLGDL